MAKDLRGRHFISTQEWTDDEIELVLATSTELLAVPATNLTRVMPTDGPAAPIKRTCHPSAFCSQ